MSSLNKKLFQINSCCYVWLLLKFRHWMICIIGEYLQQKIQLMGGFKSEVQHLIR